MRFVISYLLLVICLVLFVLLPTNNYLLITTYAEVFPKEIQMTAKGFVPSEIEVSQGDKVTFKNSDTDEHWPASDIHPTHQIYPEFDPKQPVSSGSAWTFQFQKAGSWKFHDHLYPEFVGVIKVHGDGKGVSQFDLAKIWNQTLEKFKIQAVKMYYQIFPNNLERKLDQVNMHKLSHDDNELKYWLSILGGKKYMARLIKDSGGGSIVDCHQEAHFAGRIAYQLFGAKAFQDGDFACHSGFYHGAMESFLNEKGTDNLFSKIKELCSLFKTNFANFECLHGVGHGVMAYEDYNLPWALKMCGELDGSYAQSSCYGGVFMENIVTAQGRGAKNDHSTAWVSSDPQFPCDGTDKSHDVQYQCYMMQTTRMLDLLGYGDFRPVVAECLKAPVDMIPVCLQSLGRDGAGVTLRDPQKIIQICQLVPSEFYNKCLEGALNVIVDFWGENLTNQAQELCHDISLEGSKAYCYQVLSGRLRNVFGQDDQKIKKGCGYFEGSYQQSCLSGV